MNDKNGHHEQGRSHKPFNLETFYKDEQGHWRLKRKKDRREGTCAVAYCTRPQRFDRKSRLCHTCEAREYRANNILRYSYHGIKSHAKQRGIAFTLTFEQFAAFAVKSGYIEGKGNTKPRHLQIDRVDNLKGYSIDNIQVLTLLENVSKWHNVDEERTPQIYD